MREKQTNNYARAPKKHTLSMASLGASRAGAAANGPDPATKPGWDTRPRRRRRSR